MDLPDAIHPQHGATEIVTPELPDKPNLIVEKENLPGTTTSYGQFNTSSKLSRGRISKKYITRKKRESNVNRLQESAQMYVESSREIARSIETLSSSVNTLASSFEKIAEAIIVLATAREFH